VTMQLNGLARLGRDAEVRSTASGEQVASLSLAYDYGRPGADGKRPTQWIDAALWGDRAGKLAPWLRRGKQVHVRLSDVHVEEYQKRDGTTASKLVARVAELDSASGRDDDQQQASAPRRQPASRGGYAEASGGRAAPRQQRPAPADGGWGDEDSDIPF